MRTILVGAVVLFVLGPGHNQARPTSTITDAIHESLDDVGNLIKAKADVVKYTGEALNEAAEVAAGNVASYLATTSPLEVSQDIEEAVVKAKVASIRGLFNASRAFFSQGHVAFQAMANYTSNMTLNSTVLTLQDLGQQVVSSIVQAKQALHDSTEGFSSRWYMRGLASSVVSAMTGISTGAEQMLDASGLFKTLDNFVRGFTQDVNGLATQVMRKKSEVSMKLMK